MTDGPHNQQKDTVMLTTSLNALYHANFSATNWVNIRKAKTGFPLDALFPVTDILDQHGLGIALEVLGYSCSVEGKALVRKFALDCAEHTLPVYEEIYSGSRSPRLAIQAARGYAEGTVTQEELMLALHDVRRAWSGACAFNECKTNAVSDAVYAVVCAVNAYADPGIFYTALAVEYALSATIATSTDHGEKEGAWQVDRLRELLTEVNE
ncbi:hypothetical protein UFOVP1299_30 [uncultured Caudovirales phage]|uniref:Imm-5-like domain-containing protein n=1 Tax=uncultured Caudovirales phage TaxID=2100421 RepID=A0A6J5RNF9_9CAUD|nr:hypothetical protein UFOVP1299_30 [uncultured Caudovirales phage]